MANTESRNLLQAQRTDVPDLRAIESGVVFDFQTLLNTFITSTAYTLNGFSIANAPAAINNPATSLQVVVSGATVWQPESTDGAFLVVPAGTPNEILSPSNANVLGSFAPNQINYLGINLVRAADDATTDLVQIWDVGSKTEFPFDAPRGLVLNYQFVVSTTGFGTTAPIAIVQTDISNNVISITNAKQGLYRLGQGGATPNASYTSPDFVNENPLTITSSSQPDPFINGDWVIADDKGWRNKVMSQLKAILNSAYWYSSSTISNINLTDLFNDTRNIVVTGAGTFIHSESFPGTLIWTSNVYLRAISGFRTYTLLANPNGTSMADGQVIYVALNRNIDFQPSNLFTFNGSTTVTANTAITGIYPGDWIKAAIDSDVNWRKVQSVSGNTIILTFAYPNSYSNTKALMSTGTYSLTPTTGQGSIILASPGSVPPTSNMFWVAKRDDNAFTPLTIAASGSNGLMRAANITTATTTGPTGLTLGQAITITGASDPSFNGGFEVNGFPYTFTTTAANATAGAVYLDSIQRSFTVLGTVTSSTTVILSGNAAPSGSTLFLSTGTGDSTITFSSATTPNNAVNFYNPGVNFVSGTAGGGTIAATPKIYLLGIGGGELQQGESAEIDDKINENILTFVGARNDADTTPPYTTVPNNLAAETFTTNNNLTEAISVLAANENDIYNTLNLPNYREPLVVVSGAPANSNEVMGPLSANTTLTMPLNSRRSSIAQYYTVGKGYLTIFLNGQYLPMTNGDITFGGWAEVGTTGTPSNQITINQPLDVNDVITFLITGTGGPGAGAGAADDNFDTLPVSTFVSNANPLLIYDTSINAYRQQTRGTFLAGVGGSLNVVTKTSNYSANATTDDVILVDASGGAVTITLPSAASRNSPYYVKKIDSSSNAVIIVVTGGQLIDGASSQSTTVQYFSSTVISDTVSAYWNV
jgi:hypothetical protein